MPHLIGIDVGTQALRACLFDSRGTMVSDAAVFYRTSHPRPSWVEQNPHDWWRAALEAVATAVKRSGVDPRRIVALSYACTSCTVVALDEEGEPLRPALLWMDERAWREAQKITASRHPQLKYSGGEVSPEWMIPKALWIAAHEPDIFERAYRIVEQTDYFTFMLTGRWTCSLNNVTAKWNYVGPEGGWRPDFIEQVGIARLMSKWPSEILAVGTPIHTLRDEVAREMGLPPQTLVVQGGIDAHGSVVGLSAVNPSDVSMIVGTSTCLMAQSKTPVFANVWGPYPDALIPAMYTLGGGQTTTGAIMDWLMRLTGGKEEEGGSESWADMDALASVIPPGSEGLVGLDFFQGNRNPFKDPLARGAIWGLSLRHSAAHLYRAFYEAVAYGVRSILEDLESHGFHPARIVAGGGGARSSLWMQIHADVTGYPIRLTQGTESTALGAAIWAGLGAGVFNSYEDAIERMVRMGEVFDPDRGRKKIYDFYFARYLETYAVLKPLMHRMAAFEEEHAKVL